MVGEQQQQLNEYDRECKVSWILVDRQQVSNDVRAAERVWSWECKWFQNFHQVVQIFSLNVYLQHVLTSEDDTDLLYPPIRKKKAHMGEGWAEVHGYNLCSMMTIVFICVWRFVVLLLLISHSYFGTKIFDWWRLVPCGTAYFWTCEEVRDTLR
jgi:hypothetical protein